MNRIMSFLIAVLAIQYCMASLTSKPSELPVILSSSQQKPHLVNVVDPVATLHIASGSLTVNLDNTAYSSYSVRLTPSDGGSDIVVPATSATVSIPITNTTTDYVITVEGGDYGTYDGVFSPSGRSSITLNDTQAMQLVKNRRETNSGVNIYAASVTELINDSNCCVIDTLPDCQWANNHSDKILIFVDEQPDFGWRHSCTYYYLPSEITCEELGTIVCYEGIRPPCNICLSPIEINMTFSLTDFTPPPVMWQNIMSVNAVLPSESHETKAILIASVNSVGYLQNSYINRNWNECAAMYSILRNKYCIPDDDIYILMGNEAGVLYHYNGVGYDTIPLPKDLDGDGLDEPVVAATETNLKAVFNELTTNDNMGHFKHLFLFYAGDIGVEYMDGHVELDMSRGSDGSISTYKLKELLYQLDSDYESLVFDCNEYQISSMIGSLLLSNGRVATDPTSIYQPSPNYISFPHFEHPAYNAYGYYWLSGIAGYDISSGNLVSSDYNNDGNISFNEAHQFADSSFINYNYTYSQQNYIWWPMASIHSIPESLKDSLSLSNIPAHSNLFIQRTPNNTNSDIVWNSPDIWMRNQDDGMTNQYSEQIELTTGEPVYIYVRIHNDGDGDSVNENYVNLYAAPAAEYYVQAMDFTRDYVGDSIGGFCTGTIPAHSTVIRKYIWNWDAPTESEGDENVSATIDWQALSASAGNILPIRILAHLGDDEDAVHIARFPGFMEPVPERKLTLVKHVEIDSKKLSLNYLNNTNMLPQVMRYGILEFPLNFNNDSVYSLEIIADTINSTANMFAVSPITTYIYQNESLLSNSTVQNASLDSSNPLRYKLLNRNAKFSDLRVNGIKTFKLYIEESTMAEYPLEVNWDFDVVVKNSTGKIIDGQHVRISREEAPGGGVIIVGPIIQSIRNNSNYTLMETNINEPSRYEWYDVNCKKISEGKSIMVDKNEIGEYAILKVTGYNDGKEMYAVAPLGGIPAIKCITPVPFNSNLSVVLTDNAVSGMSVRVISVLGMIQPIEQDFIEGDKMMTIETDGVPAGQYVVTLLHNGDVVQSVNVYK